jgi:hypothetical protein
MTRRRPASGRGLLDETRATILAPARRQRWARPGVLALYALVDGLWHADQLQAEATRLGDTPAGWEAVACGAALTTEAWLAFEEAYEALQRAS